MPQAYTRKLEKLKGYLKAGKKRWQDCVIETGNGGWELDFNKLTHKTFENACMMDNNGKDPLTGETIYKSYGVYTVYRSALNYQAERQDEALKPKFKKKLRRWLRGIKREDAQKKKEGKTKSQVGKRPLPKPLHGELLDLMHSSGTKKSKY